MHLVPTNEHPPRIEAPRPSQPSDVLPLSLWVSVVAHRLIDLVEDRLFARTRADR